MSLDKELGVTAVKSSSASAEEGALTESYYIDPALQRKYVREVDFKILPVIAVMYFCSAMDRSNISNAFSDGMTKDLNFEGQEYSLLLLLFYIPAGIFDLPFNILTKKYGAKWVLPSLMISWGVLTMITAACKNFAGTLVVRLLIATAESGFFSGCVFYMTLFYTRVELAFRIALFVTASVLAAAFTGLLAYAVFQIESTALHGAATVAISLFAYWWLPSTPSTCRWFSPEIKEVARLRHLKNGSNQVDSKFSWKECKERIMTWQWWVYFCISFTYPLPWTTASLFLTQIIGRFGFHTVKTNLWTVAPNCVGAVAVLCIAYSSDHFRERSYHLCFVLSLSLVGLIILATVDGYEHKAVSYFACFLLCCGAYCPSFLVHSYHNNNNLSESSRAFDSGVFVGLSNLASITASATFRTEYAPNYTPTIIATCVSAFICFCLTFFLGTWQKLENKRRNKEQGVELRAEDVDTNQLVNGTADPRWRYFT
ncbi:hypothetical protein WICANDRAFT_70275 [Wickerhamomyces anomalus NRRL Y-366-8]|uniref:Major facilitator superfamily (MFS) profile domain-containing protein n=1 Tax=Wickerhamomyces anomalus (strain ATCC 58044 / CBS 1984 / NCYC 433 / NRRL Y-366-8) TaxID=683960 RepID=A0A1E3NZ37_WICAA|nr:uncharacterized protein WICANDRAFT_70275 [Wickerhamomyces anomalus NRRL Y-366-8]ODQ58348.1 hypothetical protein WICANDRAFT_70275 [Wickerhamomyces anomalus NRRL Y-366-8]